MCDDVLEKREEKEGMQLRACSYSVADLFTCKFYGNSPEILLRTTSMRKIP